MNVNKKLLIVNSHLEVVGGVEVYLRDLIAGLKENGFDITYAYWVGTESLKGNLVENNPKNIRFIDQKKISEFESFVDSYNPNYILAQNIETPALHNLILKHQSTFYFFHDYRSVCLSGNKYWKFPKTTLCNRKQGIGCLAKYWINKCGGINPFTGIRRYLSNIKLIRSLRNYNNLIVASEHVKKILIQNGFESKKISINPYFANSENRFRPFISKKNQTKKLLFVGRDVPAKGLVHAINAVHVANEMLSREFELIVIGDKRSTIEYKKIAANLGVKISFEGWLDKNDISNFMCKSDALLVPSIWPEPFGIVGIEACCNGLPIVGYRVGGIKDWLENGVNGESPPDDEIDSILLGRSLAKVLKDEEYWNQLRKGAFNKGKEFTIEKHIKNLLRLFQVKK